MTRFGTYNRGEGAVLAGGGGGGDYVDPLEEEEEDGEENSGYGGSDEERIRLFKLFDIKSTTSTITFASTSSDLQRITSSNNETTYPWDSPSPVGCGGGAAGSGFISGETDALTDESLACNFSSAVDYSSYILEGLNGTLTGVVQNPYTVWQLVLLGVLAGVTSLVTIVGNMIVILSFVIERAIRQPTNYFIASLAVSDLFIGSISMPFYTIYLLTGKHWPLGEFLCDLWLSIDYTVCLCSIYTVFCITIDRFCSVIIPAKYRNWRTEMKVLAMVAATWLVPVLVFFTSIFGWQYFVHGRTVPEGQCYVQYMENPLFNCVLQVGYFWTTLVVMCVLYTGIYRVAAKLASRSNAKHRQTTSLVSFAGKTMTKIGIGVTQPTNAGTVDGGHTDLTHLASLTPAQGGSSTRTPTSATEENAPTREKNGNGSSGPGLLVQDGVVKVGDGSSSPGYPSDTDPSSSQSGGSTRKVNGYAAGSLPDRGAKNSNGGKNKESLLIPKIVAPPNYKATTKVGSVLRPNKGVAAEACVGTIKYMGTEVRIKPADNCQKVQVEVNEEFDEEEGAQVQKDRGNSGGELAHGNVQCTASAQPICTGTGDRGCSANCGDDRNTNSGVKAPKPEPLIFPTNTADAQQYETSKQPGEVRPLLAPPAISPIRNNNRRSRSDSAFTFPEQGETTESSTNVTAIVVVVSDNASPEHPRQNAIARAGTWSGAGSRLGLPVSEARGASVSTLASPDMQHASSSSSIFTENAALKKQSCGPTASHAFGKSPTSRAGNNSGASKKAGGRQAPGVGKGASASKSENRARKALRTITVILGAFILCWTPWHVLSMIIGFYGEQLPESVTGLMYDISYWLCYLNSPINPFCYALANQQFKKAFSRILKLDWHRT